jgi:uncharacterized membrane protein
MAILLALVTLAITAYYLRLMPYIYLTLLPANLGASGSLIFWVKAPAKKKARWKAALASLSVVPCMMITAAISLFSSPMSIWPVFAALAALALIIAIWAVVRVKRKADHPWADYYRKVTLE